MGDEPDIAQLISQLVQDDPTVEEVLHRTVTLAVRLIDRVDGASITIFGNDLKPFTMIASQDWVRAVDEIQYSTLQGPCIEVAATSAPTSGSADLARSESWPIFGPRAAAEGVGALLAAGLTARPDHLEPSRPPGALNLYSRKAFAFTQDDRDQAVLIAAIGGIGVQLAEARATAERLKEALSSRDVIGRAKGILMERHGIDEVEAFAMLRNASNRLNVKLRDVAARIAGAPAVTALGCE